MESPYQELQEETGKLARAYERLDSARNDLYMKIGKKLAEIYDAVSMEDIRELVDKSDRQRRLRLLDVGFYELKDIIKYQMEKYGKSIVLVNPAYSSKECVRCHYVNKDIAFADRVFVCPRCG